MIIDCLSDTELYVERKIEATITVNTTKNNNGVLEKDDLGNDLVSLIDTGDTDLGTLKSYNGADGVLLHNTITNEIQVCKVGDKIRVRNDYVKGVKYYVGAKRLLSTSVSNKTFTVPIGGKKILKVQLMGRDISSYSVAGDTIKILGNNGLLVDNFSEIVVYVYDDKPTSYEFVIKYETFLKVWGEEMETTSFWDNYFVGNKVENFNEATISSSVEEDKTRKTFSNAHNRMLNGVENKISVTTFDGSELFDMTSGMVGIEFRMVFFNGYFGRSVIVNNCTISDNINIIYDKNKNTKSFTIYCGNYIDISNGIDSVYGGGKYGRGKYGGERSIKNSARLGG